MNLIVISPESPHPMETLVYQKLLSEPKITHLHLRRKKALTTLEWKNFRPFASKLIYSDTCGIAPYPCLGIHGELSTTSISTHSVSEANNCSSQYCYISPIYPSISKKGYQNKNLLGAIKKLQHIPENWVALGGITPENVAELKVIGFHNVAVLGAIWNHKNPLKAYDTLLSVL
jgi:hypothetical protein